MSNGKQLSQLFKFKYDLKLTRLKEEGLNEIYKKEKQWAKNYRKEKIVKTNYNIES